MAKTRKEEYESLVKAIKQKTDELKDGKTLDGKPLDKAAKEAWREAIRQIEEQIDEDYADLRPKPKSKVKKTQ